MNVIVKMKFGSHLYGTDTINSDTDYKGIYMPSAEDIVLGKVGKGSVQSTGSSTSRNSSDDIDIEWFTLHQFIKLACQGQTVALDMLHVTDDMIVEKSDLWDEIMSNRSWYYTKSTKSFLGYAQNQAAKYGVKGSRIDTTNRVLSGLRSLHASDKIDSVIRAMSGLKLDHVEFMDDSESAGAQIKICGKTIQGTMTALYACGILEKYLSAYGQRAKDARENKNIDWKAVSHALRAADQIRQLFQDGTIKFPLECAPFLKQVKLGQLDYMTQVAPVLEAWIDEVNELSKVNQLPDTVDHEKINSWLYWSVMEYLKKDYFHA